MAFAAAGRALCLAQRAQSIVGQAKRLPVPVIVVGNIIVGGAGKTPLTLWLAGELRQRGWRPGIVSRGYGRQGARSGR